MGCWCRMHSAVGGEEVGTYATDKYILGHSISLSRLISISFASISGPDFCIAGK
jgi:hypothetical protein